MNNKLTQNAQSLQTCVSRSVTPRVRLIRKLNKYFESDKSWKVIPEDYPIRSHQKGFIDCGGQRWYFKSNENTIEKYGKHLCLLIDSIGSSSSVKDVLKFEKIVFFEENGIKDIVDP